MSGPFGYYWEIYHIPTGDVCQSGFVRGESAPVNAERSFGGPLSKDFAARLTNLFESASSTQGSANG
jgi:hypothetical protein